MIEMVDMDDKTFGKRLAEARKIRGMTQQQLADALDVHVTTIAKIETGVRKPSFELLLKIAQILNVSVDYLLGLVDHPREQLKGEVEVFLPEKRIPIVGQVSAGEGTIAEEDIIGYIAVKSDRRIDFGLVVKGNSMFPKFKDGDIVLVRKQPGPDHNGQACVVIINGEDGVVKYFYKYRDYILLKSENPDYDPIKIKLEDWERECAFIGVVVGKVEFET